MIPAQKSDCFRNGEQSLFSYPIKPAANLSKIFTLLTVVGTLLLFVLDPHSFQAAVLHQGGDPPFVPILGISDKQAPKLGHVLFGEDRQALRLSDEVVIGEDHRRPLASVVEDLRAVIGAPACPNLLCSSSPPALGTFL